MMTTAEEILRSGSYITKQLSQEKKISLSTRDFLGHNGNFTLVEGALAKNLALTPEVQLSLPKFREAAGAENSADVEKMDEIIAELVQNENTTDEALIRVVKLLDRHDAEVGFRYTVTHHDDLPPEALRVLAEVSADDDYRERIALTTLLAPRATRQLINSALVRWYYDEDDEEEKELLQGYSTFKGLSDVAFWKALAEAKDSRLREIAARNVTTPITSVLKLIEDPDDEVQVMAINNISIPPDHSILQKQTLRSLALAGGQNLSEQRLLDLVRQARETHEPTRADRWMKTLAKRNLRSWK